MVRMRSRVQIPIAAPQSDFMIFKSKHPNTIYRVGIKAVIKDESGRVLCVHDTGDDDMWSLPGGGLDHGDGQRNALARELQEEIAYKGEFDMEYIDTCIYASHAIGAYVLYIIFNVTLKDAYTPIAGVDAKEVAYLTSSSITAYTDRQADMIRKFGFDSQIEIPIYK